MGTYPKTKNVCIVIPAYNESKVIAKVVKGVFKKAKELSITLDVIVVDDGSFDDTYTQASKAGAIVIRHILNSGAGGATATGLSYAHKNDYDIAATMDADGQHDVDDVINGITLLNSKEIDLLIGSRLINSDGMSKVKLLGNRGLSFITFLLFGVNSTDSQSGLRIFSKKSLSSLKWESSGYEFCSEMMWRAKQQGLIIDEYPIKAIYTDYSKSKGQSNWNAINIISRLLKRRLIEVFG